MKKSNINQFLQYLSPILIISYFFIHKIFIVLVGITISLIIININYIDEFYRSIIKRLTIKDVSREPSKNKKPIKSDSNNIELIKDDSKLTLVETIEELGFIPSIDKDDDISTA